MFKFYIKLTLKNAVIRTVIYLSINNETVIKNAVYIVFSF
jgi:hypothetical protein